MGLLEYLQMTIAVAKKYYIVTYFLYDFIEVQSLNEGITR